MMGLHALVWGSGLLAAGGDAAATGFDPYQFAAAGVTPALVVYLLVFTDRLYTKGAVTDLRQQRDRAQDNLEDYTKQVAPLLTLTTRVLDKLAPIITTDVTIRTTPSREGQG